ncbi:hypothetical protein E3J61_01675 [Candidatus Dependentiae bacterium]|nr:MAG: hypothetical protein E3J61_01675 [Candidatus Dependentiae bacterium]
MYKKLLILLFVCSSAFAMDAGKKLVNGRQAGLLSFLPLLMVRGGHQANRATVENGPEAGLCQLLAQERTVFGFDCSLCKSHLSAESQVMLANEARRHLFIRHRIVATGLELQGWLEGEKLPKEDTIFV